MPRTKKGNACGAGSFPGCTADGGMKGKLAEGGRMRNVLFEYRKRVEFNGIFPSEQAYEKNNHHIISIFFRSMGNWSRY